MLAGAAALPTSDPSLVIDADALVSMIGGDRQLLGQLFELFLADAPAHIQRMNVAIAVGDLGTVKSASHALKGAAGSLRMNAVAQNALRVEMAAIHNDSSAAELALGDLRRSLDDVPAAIQFLMETV